MENMKQKKVILDLAALEVSKRLFFGDFIRSAAQQQGWSAEEIKVILDECKAGDYDHLLQTLIANTTESSDENED